VSSPRATSAHALDEILSRLPKTVGVGHRGRDRLLISTGGVFVLRPIEQSDSITEAREDAQELAEVTRDRLADHVTWVPFVDRFLVADDPNAGLGVLPTGFIASTTLEGHAVEPQTAIDLCRLLELGHLAPLWHHGLPMMSESLGGAVANMRPLS